MFLLLDGGTSILETCKMGKKYAFQPPFKRSADAKGRGLVARLPEPEFRVWKECGFEGVI